LNRESRLVCTRVFLGSDCELIPSYGQIRTEFAQAAIVQGYRCA
jgi:hypothetical protein